MDIRVGDMKDVEDVGDVGDVWDVECVGACTKEGRC